MKRKGKAHLAERVTNDFLFARTFIGKSPSISSPKEQPKVMPLLKHILGILLVEPPPTNASTVSLLSSPSSEQMWHKQGFPFRIGLKRGQEHHGKPNQGQRTGTVKVGLSLSSLPRIQDKMEGSWGDPVIKGGGTVFQWRGLVIWSGGASVQNGGAFQSGGESSSLHLKPILNANWLFQALIWV
jgi:hypothetical protein